MRETAPGSYENLFYADYPDKNRSQVNMLACKNITSDEAKKQIVNQINEQIKPKIDAKTADMNPIAAEALKKTVEKTIEQFVDKAIDSFVKNLDKIDTKENVKN